MNRLYLFPVTVLVAFCFACYLVLPAYPCSIFCTGACNKTQYVKNGLTYYKCAGQGTCSGGFFWPCSCYEFGPSCLCG
jgi:hypothetical protein